MFRSLKTFVLACSSVGLIVGPAFDAQACPRGGFGGGIGGGFGGGYGAPRASCQPSYPQQQPYCPQCTQRPQFPQSGYEQLNQQNQFANSQYPSSQFPGTQYPGQFQGNQGQFDGQFQSPPVQNPQPQPQPFRSTQLQGLQSNQIGTQSQGVPAQQFQGGQAQVVQGQQVQGQQVQGQQVQGQQVQGQGQQVQGQQFQGQQVQGQQVQGQQVQGQGGQTQTAFRPRTTQVAARVGAPSASQSALSALGAAPVQGGTQQPVQQQPVQQQQQTQQPIANPAPQQSAPVDSQGSAPAEQPQQQLQSPETSGSYSAESDALKALLGTGVAQQPAAGQQAAGSAQTSGQFRATVGGATVQLNLNGNGTFQWIATKDGKPTSFDGNFTIQNGALTLQRTDNTKLEGTIAFSNNGFNLKFAGTKDQKDNGLEFVRG